MTKFYMTTTFGKRRGWEIQRFRLRNRSFFYRLTRRDSCAPASASEIDLWRYAGLAFGADGDVERQ